LSRWRELLARSGAGLSGFMARVLGESGRYVSQQATKRQHSMWTLCIICMAVVGTILGFMLRASVPWLTVQPLTGLLFSIVLLLVLWLVGTWTFRRIDELERERNNMRRGAAGEKVVEAILSKLPEDFCVVNDLSTSTGNLDHVVIGPTGVFVIETKNCRGVIASDGKGELTVNGKAAKKRHVSRLIGRMMGLRDKVRVLAPDVDPYYNAVMVFTSAWVDAKFGTTGRADCIRDDRLLAYIIDHKPRAKLLEGQVGSVAQAFASLARRDADFAARVKQESAGSAACVAGASA
jgi:hypothetical protein